SVAARQQTLRYCSNWPIYAAFSFAMCACRGQDYLMHLVRAPSCKRRGFGGRHTMAGPLLRTVPRHWFDWGVRRGRREPASFAFGPSHRPRESAAIDEEVLPGDVAGLGGAQKGAGGAEFSRRAEALGGHGRHALAPCLLDRDTPVLGNSRHVRLQPFRLECAGQEKVDGDVGRGNRARDPGEESGQTRARPRGEIEAGERHLHRARGDVDDAPEFLGAHGVDDLLDELDRHHHVADDAVDDALTRELAKIAEWRPAVVVHQNVRLRAGGKQRRLAGVATSPTTAVTLAPVACRSSAAVASSVLPSRPLTTTSQPACASAKAQARPSPRLEAQTIALRPEIPRSMGRSSGGE